MELPPLAAMARATETLLSLCPCFLQSSQQPLQCSASKPLLPQVTFLWSGPCPDDSIGCRHTHWAELQEDGEDLGGMSRGGGERGEKQHGVLEGLTHVQLANLYRLCSLHLGVCAWWGLLRLQCLASADTE